MVPCRAVIALDTVAIPGAVPFTQTAWPFRGRSRVFLDIPALEKNPSPVYGSTRDGNQKPDSSFFVLGVVSSRFDHS